MNYISIAFWWLLSQQTTNRIVNQPYYQKCWLGLGCSVKNVFWPTNQSRFYDPNVWWINTGPLQTNLWFGTWELMKYTLTYIDCIWEAPLRKCPKSASVAGRQVTLRNLLFQNCRCNPHSIPICWSNCMYPSMICTNKKSRSHTLDIHIVQKMYAPTLCVYCVNLCIDIYRYREICVCVNLYLYIIYM